MLDGIVGLVLGLVLIVGFLAGYITNINTSNLDASSIALLAVIVPVAMVLLVYGFVKVVRESKFGI